MLTTCHLLDHSGQLVGIGLVLVSLFGCFTLPVESASALNRPRMGIIGTIGIFKAIRTIDHTAGRV